MNLTVHDVLAQAGLERHLYWCTCGAHGEVFVTPGTTSVPCQCGRPILIERIQ